MSSQNIVREYPSMRPAKFTPDERLLGFKGKFERGIWVQPPHHGPIFPAGIPTPPHLVLRMVEQSVFQLIEDEEEWWQKMAVQTTWEGEIEPFSGGKDALKLVTSLSISRILVVIFISVCLSVCCLSTCPSVHLPVCPPAHQSLCANFLPFALLLFVD